MRNAFLDGAATLFTFAADDWYKMPSDEEAIRQDWEIVGSYIRGAMSETAAN
ncbi:MAG: hypothetical protein Q4C78_00905 [Synergistaceae bacterium]|nr:hypothetical protein [Synergistaceae bacterium]